MVEHVGGQVGHDDAPGGEPVAVCVQVGVTQVVGDVLVAVVRLRNEQVRVPPSRVSGGAAAAAAGPRAGGAGSRSRRSSTSPHAGPAAATRLAA